MLVTLDVNHLRHLHSGGMEFFFLINEVISVYVRRAQLVRGDV